MLNKDFSDSISIVCAFINVCLFIFGVIASSYSIQMVAGLNVFLFFVYFLFCGAGEER